MTERYRVSGPVSYVSDKPQPSWLVLDTQTGKSVGCYFRDEARAKAAELNAAKPA